MKNPQTLKDCIPLWMRRLVEDYVKLQEEGYVVEGKEDVFSRMLK